MIYGLQLMKSSSSLNLLLLRHLLGHHLLSSLKKQPLVLLGQERMMNLSLSLLMLPQWIRKSVVSPIDELEDFAMGKPQTYPQEHSDIFTGEEETETNSAAAASAAALKEAMDRAEAKFKHAKEVRERERDAKFTKIKEPMHQEDLEDDWELEQKEWEYREEQKRLAKEREQELERELERTRQAVERATREARERATAEAQLRAERAAVEKANAEANFSRGFHGAQSSGYSSAVKKASSAANFADDIASIFGGPPSSGEFQEIEGESEKRRRARFEQHQRTLECARIAETLDIGIKQWASGKEGNLHALLSTLHMYFGLNVAGNLYL
ncbi:unnamed protein product [Musa acuminata subsp. burmannicoides]